MKYSHNTTSKHGVVIEHGNGYLHITSQPHGWMGLFAKIFLIFVAALSWIFFLQKLIAVSNAEILFAYIIPFFHLGFSIVVSYVALAYCINKAHIYVSKDVIEVFSAPIWMAGHKRVDAKTLDKIYFYYHSSYHGGVKSELRAKLKNKNDVTLARNIISTDQADRIQQEIARFLDSKD